LLALALTIIPDNSDTSDPVSKFVQVRLAPAAVALQLSIVENIVGYTHVIPEIGNSSITGDRWKERWIGNSHIDLATSK
jgi:hypothetical protein